MRAVAIVLLVLGLVGVASAMSAHRLKKSCKGDCLDANKHKCKWGFKTGMCPGAANIQCCEAPPASSEPGVGASCPEGTCTLVSSGCNGKFVSGLCPGSADVQCCQAAATSSAPPSRPDRSAPPSEGGNDSLNGKFKSIWKWYPHGEAEEVKKHLGGEVNQPMITNTCVIRVARALSMAGIKIRPFTLQNGKSMYLIRDGQSNRLPIRVAEFKQYMVAKYGQPQVKVAFSTDGVDEIPSQLNGKRGIIMFDVRVWSDATGHFDLWDGEGCAHQCYFDKARNVWLWILN